MIPWPASISEPWEVRVQPSETFTQSILVNMPMPAHLGDSWRFNPKLTLNYSLRWDYISPFKEKFNNLSFIDPVGDKPRCSNRIGSATPRQACLCWKQMGRGQLRQGLSRGAVQGRLGSSCRFRLRTR